MCMYRDKMNCVFVPAVYVPISPISTHSKDAALQRYNKKPCSGIVKPPWRDVCQHYNSQGLCKTLAWSSCKRLWLKASGSKDDQAWDRSTHRWQGTLSKPRIPLKSTRWTNEFTVPTYRNRNYSKSAISPEASPAWVTVHKAESLEQLPILQAMQQVRECLF